MEPEEWLSVGRKRGESRADTLKALRIWHSCLSADFNVRFGRNQERLVPGLGDGGGELPGLSTADAIRDIYGGDCERSLGGEGSLRPRNALYG